MRNSALAGSGAVEAGVVPGVTGLVVAVVWLDVSEPTWSVVVECVDLAAAHPVNAMTVSATTVALPAARISFFIGLFLVPRLVAFTLGPTR
jgi:hypothetical protein